MITKVNAYQSSDGTAHSSLEEAQKAEIINVFKTHEKWDSEHVEEVADSIMDHAEAIIDILTTKPNSLTKARKVNGGTKRRKKGEQPQTEPLPLVAAEEALRK